MRPAATTTPGRTPNRTPIRRAVVASLVGNALEWYDFFLYGTAAALVFNQLFFPTVDPLAGTIAAFGTYALGFAARPLGGLVFGHFGDRIGRRSMLVATLTIMGAATFLIGLLPTYDRIGIAAPVLLTVLRVVQGIAVGGEWGGGVLLISENADPKRRGMLSALSQTGVGFGFVLSALVFAVVAAVTDEEQFLAWGWRVPFLLGALLMGAGLVIRLKVLETAAFAETRERHRVPALEAVRRHPRAVLVTFGARIAENGGSYIFLTFVLAYASRIGVPGEVTLTAVVLGMALEALAMPAWGALSDRVGRRPVYAFGAVAVVAWAWPFFVLLDTRQPALVILAVVVANAVCHGAMIGTQPAFFSELFGSGVRYSGVAIGHELASVLAGGLSPLIATALLAWAGGWWPVAGYLAVMGAITVAAVLASRETAATDLGAVGAR
ncbi:MAG TPA: MFS transporter [Pseudonocardia sp.]|jgi:metabolite-proton symporter|uniref:MFS transporter n=1 Tax=Pseudonocardia sp. TaxID=60912 RepID=UPI002B4B60A8|nr:MFS transporter [Pseudonocardia sp.]HLU54676.1 MFS transporter [Pseudonocardia sp.]